jgi:hypothetical protein
MASSRSSTAALRTVGRAAAEDAAAAAAGARAGADVAAAARLAMCGDEGREIVKLFFRVIVEITHHFALAPLCRELLTKNNR